MVSRYSIENARAGQQHDGGTAASAHAYSTLEVFGEGTVSAAADRATIVLGVETEKPELQAALDENARQIADIIQALYRMGIPAKNIQTSEYRIEMQYDFVEGKQVFRGYRVTHMLTITADRVAETGRIVNEAVTHGANIIRSITFSISNPLAYESQALTLALRTARFKAETMAATMGVRIGATPYKVQELSASAEPIPFYSAKVMAATTTPIQPGQLTVKATVRVWYFFA